MELLLLLIKLCPSVKQMVGTQQHKRIPPVILFWHHIGPIRHLRIFHNAPHFGSFSSCSEEKSPMVRFPDPKQY